MQDRSNKNFASLVVFNFTAHGKMQDAAFAGMPSQDCEKWEELCCIKYIRVTPKPPQRGS